MQYKITVNIHHFEDTKLDRHRALNDVLEALDSVADVIDFEEVTL